MKKSDLKFMPQFFDRYINLVSDELTLLESLEVSKNELEAIQPLLEQFQDYRYREGKWTPKDMLQHIIDTERVQAYRALAFSRGDVNELSGYDENLYAKNTNISERTVQDLLEEFRIIRVSTILLFKNFTDEMLQAEGKCFGKMMTSLALGFVIVGHPKHHINILRERYFTKQ